MGGGGVRPVEDLERFVHDAELGLLFDARQKAPGRGVWVTPGVDELRAALDGGFSRGFKTRVKPPDLASLMADMRVGITRRLIDTMSSAVRARSAHVGAAEVERVMQRDRADVVLLASDASDSTVQKFSSNADRKNIPVIRDVGSKAELASWCGRDEVAVLALEAPFSSRVRRDLKHLYALAAFEG